jgi:hypothetical protein
MPENTKSTDYVRVPDRAMVATNRILGVAEDAAKAALLDAIEIAIKRIRNTLQDIVTDAVESALFAAHDAVTNTLRDEFAELACQVVNETCADPES